MSALVLADSLAQFGLALDGFGLALGASPLGTA
jgi:hypothetical protein